MSSLILNFEEHLQEYIKNSFEKIPGGNSKSKKRRIEVLTARAKYLEPLRRWRDLKVHEDKRQEKITEYYKPEDEDAEELKKTTPKAKYFVQKIDKNLVEKMGKFHYLNCLILASILAGLYILTNNFNIFGNIFFLVPITGILTASIVFFIANITYSARIVTHIDNIDLRKYVILRMGEPGTGKSSSACYDAVIMANKLWKKLRFKFWLISKKIMKIYSGTHIEHKVIGKTETGKPIIAYERVYASPKIRTKIKRTVEIVEAYEYYQEHINEVIPCLYSTIPVEDELGRYSLQITASHLLQEEKLLSYSVGILEEIGSMLPTQLSSSKIEVLDLFFRFVRQFSEFHLISTEQDGKAVVISARRVTAENKRMTGQKHILKPILLTKLCDRLEQRYVDKDKEPTAVRTWFIKNLRAYVDSVGYRKFTYVDNGNLETVGSEKDIGEKGKEQSFIAPPHLNCTYDDRTFENLNKAKDLAANPVIWNGLTIEEPELKKIFNKKILSKAYKEVA